MLPEDWNVIFGLAIAQHTRAKLKFVVLDGALDGALLYLLNAWLCE